MDAAAPLTITLKPSPRLAWLLGIAHAAAAGAVSVLELPAWLTVALVVALAAHGVLQTLRLALLRRADAVVAVEAGRASGVPFRTRNGTWQAAQLLGSTYVSPALTVLNLKPVGARRARHVVILPDAVDADDFRRLRVWLRWGRHDAAAGNA